MSFPSITTQAMSRTERRPPGIVLGARLNDSEVAKLGGSAYRMTAEGREGMYCSSCGTAVNPGLSYCNHCGAELNRKPGGRARRQEAQNGMKG